MPGRANMGHRARTVMIAAALFVALGMSARPSLAASHDQAIPAIVSGYGADGPYRMEIQSVANPAFARKAVQVFLPQGVDGKRPVIFFAHGYGAGEWEMVYGDLIRHMVSRGYVVVYSTYPALFATMDQRYDDLWQGFQAAATRFSDRMDLTRVGFVGHSFGGGTAPALAYRGIVRQAWGKQGAFMMALAPWYSFQITPDQWRQFPRSMLQVVEVYDQDTANDHRMAIDQYDSSHVDEKFYFLVRSSTMGDTTIVADHSTPGRNASLRQKQYAVFRPFDAAAEAAFTHSADAHKALAKMGASKAGDGYQPLNLQTHPTPAQPESYYQFPWSGRRNPRMER